MRNVMVGFVAAAAFLVAITSSVFPAEWESNTAVFSDITITATPGGTKSFSYTNHGFLVSDAEGDSMITCSGGGEITDAATTLKLACELTDVDGDKMYFLVERTAEDSFAAGEGRLRSSGGTGKHARRKFECTYSFTYLPKLGDMSSAPVTTRNRCKGDLPS